MRPFSLVASSQNIGFGCTVGALGFGLKAMLRNDQRRSQSMMRFRVFFQLLTVTALVGGIYYRAFNGDFSARISPDAPPRVDNRAYMLDPRVYDIIAVAAAADGQIAKPAGEADAQAGVPKAEVLR